MNDEFPREGPSPYPELNRAAGAGLCLIGCRSHFRRLGREAMSAFASADAALRNTRFDQDRPPVYRAFDAAHTAYAYFISDTLEKWAEEDGIDLPPECATRHAPTADRNRVDDILDGYVSRPESEDFAEGVFNECARHEFDGDRLTAKRLYCIALTWGVDLRHCREEPGWARRQGVFPGAEAAPTLACLMLHLGRNEEDHDAPRSTALRLASMAVSRIKSAAYAYGRACCAEFEYASAVGGEQSP